MIFIKIKRKSFNHSNGAGLLMTPAKNDGIKRCKICTLFITYLELTSYRTFHQESTSYYSINIERSN